MTVPTSIAQVDQPPAEARSINDLLGDAVSRLAAIEALLWDQGGGDDVLRGCALQAGDLRRDLLKVQHLTSSAE